MKYPSNQFDLLKAFIFKAIQYYKLTVEDCKQTALMHDLHFKAFQHYTYNDSHPMFDRVNRLVPVNRSFELYPAGCKDSHIETAIKNVVSQLISERPEIFSPAL